MAIKELRINRKIRSREVFVIDADGTQRGVMNTYDAVQMAEDLGLDLVEVSPNANPPVCKILDFGKYRYEQEKRMREAKKNQTVTKIKEVRMQPKIEKHDMETKSRAITEFLGEGNKVKISVRFRGRELAHTELGKVVLDKILDVLGQNNVSYILERSAKMEGRMMSITVAPGKNTTASTKNTDAGENLASEDDAE
ncbi:translation initiation factor IF-3 [Parasphaerochaeta coccoides]|uniref:Translation initiation factor IF-3 n=1 Tax=Parasphaerochaeta coccoides (strain ATCC BAA-1237 / DSM 17374 / SPN1) TaxID=760011 RepID=F4GIL7_PARC1|nr:translation initiation factor IF-3 [Parasphaerochaeta coccoides]AEC02151.1 bacterial translation initiation factor 3 (bIF-3) [Parasphaerochaeta coccoides DSM 17374]